MKFRDLVELVSDGIVNTEPWESNYLESNAEFISLFTKETNNDETKFQNLIESNSTLSDTLRKDLINSKGVEQFFDVSLSKIEIYEVLSTNPNAMTLVNPMDEVDLIIICNSQLVYMINSLFTKIQMLISSDLYCDCLPMHMHKFESDEYSDENLLARFINDLELFDRDSIKYFENTPEFFGNPYNLVEKIESARKFILYHELAHNSSNLIDPYINKLEKDIYKNYRIEDLNILSNWSTELACDLVACDFIIEQSHNKFKALHESNMSDLNTVIYETQSAYRGIIQLFFLYDMIQFVKYKEDSQNHIIRKVIDDKYPPVSLRLRIITEKLMFSDFFKRYKVFRDDFIAFLYRITELSLMFSGFHHKLSEDTYPFLTKNGIIKKSMLKQFYKVYIAWIDSIVNPILADCELTDIQRESKTFLSYSIYKDLKHTLIKSYPIKYSTGNYNFGSI